MDDRRGRPGAESSGELVEPLLPRRKPNPAKPSPGRRPVEALPANRLLELPRGGGREHGRPARALGPQLGEQHAVGIGGEGNPDGGGDRQPAACSAQLRREK